MIRQRSKWLVVVVIGSVFIAGCGSSSSSSSTSSQSSSPAATTAATTSSTPASTTGTTSTPSTIPNPASSAGLADAVAECRSVIKEAPTLGASTKAKVEAICNKAADGDLAGARAAAKEVCEEVINASPIPAGAIKEHALAACKAAQ
jgi:predicted lipid-binding transport protein (Tim44 family)